MAITMPGTITGAAQTGFTSPVFTATPDSAPNAYSKQVAVTALTSGTAAGVRYHSASDPFTATIERPATFAGPPVLNAAGLLPVVRKNRYVIRVRKGVIPLTGQNPLVFPVEITMNLPAGADVNDPVNVRAALSVAFGLAWQLAGSVGDTVNNGIL